MMNKETDTFELIVQFNRLSGQEVNWPARWPSQDTLALKLKLIKEELAELEAELDKKESLYDTAKEIADVLFTVHGLATALGIHSQACLKEVSESNLSKYSLDGEVIRKSVQALNFEHGKGFCSLACTDHHYFVRRNSDGKVLKPISYFSPDLTKTVLVFQDYVKLGYESIKAYFDEQEAKGDVDVQRLPKSG